MTVRVRPAIALGALTAVLVGGTVAVAPASTGATASFTRTYASVAPGTIGAYYTDRYGVPHNVYSSPAVGDVTGDGVLDLVAGQANGYVYVYRASDGAYETRIQVDPTAGMVVSSPTLVDLNGDGRLDIVAGFMPQNEAAATRTVGGFDGVTGAVLFSKKTCTGSGKPCNVFSTIAIGDVDGDGAPDLVATSQDHFLHAWRTDGTNLPGFPVAMYDTTWSSPSIVDLDKDGTTEIVTITDLDTAVCQGNPGASCAPNQYGSAVRVIESNGVVSASRVIQGEITISSPAVGDVTGDGYPEIVFTSGSCFRFPQSGCGTGSPPSNGAERLLHVLDRNLDDIFAPRALKNAAQTSPALLNVNGGAGEIAVTDNEGWLYLFDAAGNQLWATCGRSNTSACRDGIYGTTPSIGTDASPVAGDVDNDGQAEIVFQGEGILRVYDGATGAVEFAWTLYGDPFPIGNQVSSPVIFTMGNVTRIAYHVLFEANASGQRDGGDRDGMFLFTSTSSGVGAYSWPAFRGNATDRHGSQGDLPRIDYPSTPEGRFIAKAYVDLLGRQVDGEGLRYWYSVVRTSGRAPFARQLVFAPSCEWPRAVVAGYYQSILGRAPDNTGSEGWTADLCTHRRLAKDVAAFFYGLPEFYNARGGTPESFVDTVYPAIMGRAPDAGGRAYWIARVRQSGSTAVAAVLYQQQEPREHRVTSQYIYLLGRQPDAGGRVYWANRLLGQDDLELTIDLMSSEEYHTTP